MLTIVILEALEVVVLLVVSRKRVEDALPWFAFLLVLLPGAEAKLVVPGLFDINTVRVALLTLLILYLYRGRKQPKRKIPLLGLMFVSIGWDALSTLFSVSVVTSTKQLITQGVEYYLIYYLVMRLVSQTETIHKIAYAIVAAMGICSLLGVFEVYGRWSVISLLPSNLWLTYYGQGTPLYIEEGRGLRIRATFPHPILFGYALAMAIPIAFYLVSVWKSKREKWLLQAIIPLLFWAVYRTSSRGPWLATVLSLAVFALLVKNKARRYLAILIVLGALGVASRPGVWSTVSTLYDATQDSTSAIGSSYDYRYIVAAEVIDALKADSFRAIVGFGMGTFRERGLRIHFMGEEQRWYTCDNNWALLLYETGFVGLILTGMLLFYALSETFRGYRRFASPSKYLHAVLAISLGVFYLGLWGVAGYSWGQQAYMAWMFIALGIAHRQLMLREMQQSGKLASEKGRYMTAAVFRAQASGQ